MATEECETVVYSLNGVWITHTEPEHTDITHINIHINHHASSVEDFFEKIKPAFLWWGKEHGFVYTREFTRVRLVLLTDAGRRICTATLPLLVPHAWEGNWATIKGDIFTQLSQPEWIWEIESVVSLHLDGRRNTFRAPSPQFAESSDLVVLQFQPLTQ